MAKCGISFEFIFRNIHAYIFSNTWQEILAILAILIRAKTWESAKSPKLPIWKWPNVRFRLNLFLGTWIHTYADTIFLTDKTQWALNEPLLSPQWAFTPNSMSFDANFTYNTFWQHFLKYIIHENWQNSMSPKWAFIESSMSLYSKQHVIWCKFHIQHY